MDGALGPRWTPEGCLFRVWAPEARAVSIGSSALPHALRLEAQGDGLFVGSWRGARPGDTYRIHLDDRAVTDPYARFLPEGVHGPAELTTGEHAWRAPQRPIDLATGPAIYELHVGTFTAEGTYAAARARLPHLRELGVSVVELMPLAAFAGRRGWGYDGVAPFAPHAPYGRPDELRRLVDEAHALGLSVMLDVVLNHFGPDGNYLPLFARDYFDEQRVTPWGAGPAFGHPRMRGLATEVVRYWLEEFRFDGLRLDATHTMADDHLLAELAALAHGLPGRPIVVAEDDRNEPALITEHGLDGLWADDFHHAVHVLLTGEQEGYYAAYPPRLDTLARTLERGWYYEGQPWPASGEPRGKPAEGVPRSRLITCLENHDQVGNRAFGERLSHLVDRAALRGATLAWLMSPTTPMLFMGQEWAASAPFLYFTDHTGALAEQVVAGRRREFARFAAFADPETQARIPDPQAAETARRSTLDWDERSRGHHAEMLALYRQALALRRTDAVLARPDHGTTEVGCDAGLLWMRRRLGQEARLVLWNTTPDPRPARGATGAPLIASAPLEGATLPGHAAAVFVVS